MRLSSDTTGFFISQCSSGKGEMTPWLTAVLNGRLRMHRCEQPTASGYVDIARNPIGVFMLKQEHETHPPSAIKQLSDKGSDGGERCYRTYLLGRIPATLPGSQPYIPIPQIPRYSPGPILSRPTLASTHQSRDLNPNQSSASSFFPHGTSENLLVALRKCCRFLDPPTVFHMSCCGDIFRSKKARNLRCWVFCMLNLTYISYTQMLCCR